MKATREHSEIKADQAADFFLSFCPEHGDCLTNLKLQKLLYYAQAWHLALKRKPLFEDPIEAWVHGPVVPSIYRRFKKYGWQIITEAPAKPALLDGTETHLTEIFSVYGSYSAWDLERMTHQEEPWRRARAGLAIDEEGHHEIARADMEDFYRRLGRNK